LNALGTVAKDQQLADGCRISGKPNCLRAYGYIYLLLIFGHEPLGMSLCRLRGQLFMLRLNMEKLPDSTINFKKTKILHNFYINDI
jgi:hypothetical protein